MTTEAQIRATRERWLASGRIKPAWLVDPRQRRLINAMAAAGQVCSHCGGSGRIDTPITGGDRPCAACGGTGVA